MTTPTVVQTKIRWTGRRTATSGTPIRQEGNAINVPLANRGQDSFGVNSVSPGFVVTKSGFPSIIVAHHSDPAVAEAAQRFANTISYVLENSDAYGLTDLFKGTNLGDSRQIGENIVIYLSQKTSPDAQGYYEDLDEPGRNSGFSAADVQGLTDWLFVPFGASTDANLDFIEIFNNPSTDIAKMAGHYVQVFFHEILHRKYGHDYNEKYQSYNSLTARDFVNPYDVEKGIEHPVYAGARAAMLKLFEDGRILDSSGKAVGQPGAMTVPQYREKLKERNDSIGAPRPPPGRFGCSRFRLPAITAERPPSPLAAAGPWPGCRRPRRLADLLGSESVE
jgi:hypothetical protein